MAPPFEMTVAPTFERRGKEIGALDTKGAAQLQRVDKVVRCASDERIRKKARPHAHGAPLPRKKQGDPSRRACQVAGVASRYSACLPASQIKLCPGGQTSDETRLVDPPESHPS